MSIFRTKSKNEPGVRHSGNDRHSVKIRVPWNGENIMTYGKHAFHTASPLPYGRSRRAIHHSLAAIGNRVFERSKKRRSEHIGNSG